MKLYVLLLTFAISFIAVSQNLQSGLPSDNFFSPFSLHRASFTLLPSVDYRLNSRGPLFNSENYKDANVSEFLKTMLINGKSKNYLSFNIQTSLFDFHKKTRKGEIAFGIGMKAGGLFFSKITLPSIPQKFDTFSFMHNGYVNPDIKIRINTYTAVSYSFSFLRNINRKHLQNYGLKIEILTGLNAIKGSFKSNDLQVKDTNTINMVIKRKGYIARSKSKLFPEELLPFFKNPGIAISYGLKWQLSAENRFSFNITDLGFIYFSRTKSFLHRSNDTLNLKSKDNPFAAYSDSMKAYSNDHNEAYYFLPFNLNVSYEHIIDKKHSIKLIADCNPMLQYSQLSVFFCKNIRPYQLIPSLHLINFDQVSTGLGINLNSKFISWGININYLSGTLNFYKNIWQETYNFGNRNNLQTTFHIYYNLIKKTTRLNSKNHKLNRTYVRA